MAEEDTGREAGKPAKGSTAKNAGFVAIVVAALGAGGFIPTLISAVKDEVKTSGSGSHTSHKYSLVIQRETDGSPISGANVELLYEAEGKHKTSDSDGRVVFDWLQNTEPIDAHVVIFAKGYKNLNREVTVPPRDGSDEFALAIDEAPTEKLPYTRDYSTGAVPSGSGIGWSVFYPLQADPHMPGYQIDPSASATYYVVSGDRNCSSNPPLNTGWLDCNWTNGSPSATNASMQFRLQGHNEWSGPGIGLSSGRLHVTYVPSH